MTQPLALVSYEKLLPGTQLVNRLQDLGWRVQVAAQETPLAQSAEEHKPVLVFVDLVSNRRDICSGVAKLRHNPATAHVPVIAFTADSDKAVFDAAVQAGATLVVSDTALLQHLSQFIDQALMEF